ncbi:unnamed protein product [Zymoseptoria tritici ST99CH_3D7]|nr:unnamed protein product [Zymoseptoria tritici ST99CH_3D7]
MRGLLRPSTINNISKNIKLNGTQSLIKMAPASTFVGLPVIPPNDTSLNATSPKPRGIQKVFEAREQPEGAGATVRRSVGTPRLRHLSPFLMMDHASVGPGAGFTDHPHRGMETITLVLRGSIDHEDFSGNKGAIEVGDLQFMTAGRGIVHAEMPRDKGDGTDSVAIQIWVDLPKQLKDCEPRYRDLRASEIPVAKSEDGKTTVKVISGRSYGVDSVQELAYTPVWLLDVEIQPGGRFVQSLPAGWNAYAYTIEGSTTWNTGATKQEVPQHHISVFEQQGDQVVAEVPADAKETARIIVAAGMPLEQNIVQHGPFVMTTPFEIRQAFMDFSTHSNGFERADGWQSEIAKPLMG